MARSGTYNGYEPDQWGGKIIIQTSRGPWKIDNKTGSQPQIPVGTPVTFEAAKQGNFWHCTSIAPSGGPPPSQGYQQAPQQQAQAPLHQDPPGASQACAIFVTGVIGRAVHGTGNVPDANSLGHMVAQLRTAWEVHMEGKKGEVFDFPAQSESPDPGDWQQ